MSSGDRLPFARFYETVFIAEHRHRANVALHVLGTLAGLAYLGYSVWMGPTWLVLFFPVVHAAPGLLGHRLFERNAAVGNLRVLRTDYPGYWFLLGNHVMLFRLLRGRLHATSWDSPAASAGAK